MEYLVLGRSVSCCKLLKRGGIMFTATINRTLTSYIKAIIGAEYILRWLPIGTHEWEKFVNPDDLTLYAKKNSLKFKKIDGVVFDPFKQEWKIDSDKSVNYITKYKKN